LPNKLLKPNM